MSEMLTTLLDFSWSRNFIKNIIHIISTKCLHSSFTFFCHFVSARTLCSYTFQFKCCSYVLLLFFCLSESMSALFTQFTAISLIHECLFVVCLFAAHWKVFFFSYTFTYMKNNIQHTGRINMLRIHNMKSNICHMNAHTFPTQWTGSAFISLHFSPYSSHFSGILFFPQYMNGNNFGTRDKKTLCECLCMNLFHYNDFVAFRIWNKFLAIETCGAVCLEHFFFCKTTFWCHWYF